MTATQLAALIGRTGTLHTGALVLDVTVVDVKESYGRVRYLVEPVAGTGQMWTENVTLTKGEEAVAA